jgi:cardiolipin-specific phospholipase
MHQILMAPAGGESALHHLLEPGAWARNPLINRDWSSLACPVSFYYGEKDWMDSAPAMNIIRNHLTVCGTVYMVPDADHHIYCDNPADLQEKILFDCFGPGEGVEVKDVHDSNFLDDFKL